MHCWPGYAGVLGVSLTSRILAVNIIALGLLAGSLFYLDSYRNRLLAERFQLAGSANRNSRPMHWP